MLKAIPKIYVFGSPIHSRNGDKPGVGSVIFHSKTIVETVLYRSQWEDEMPSVSKSESRVGMP